ncbi:MAG: Usg family protein [Pseudomonadota bacterium]
MRDLSLMLNDYRLTTAEILYHLPDHPDLLQTFVWQDYDLAPQFPVLGKFVKFWEGNIEGRLHSIKVATSGLVQPTTYSHANHLLTLQ